MHVLILSCNTGEGHNSAGRAIKEYFLSQNIPCEMADTLSFGNHAYEQFIIKGHIFAYRNMPHLFGLGYQVEERFHPEDRKSVLYRSNISYADRLYRYIQLNGFDTVICVHIFAASAMTEIRVRYAPLLRVYFVATDYTCSPGVSDLDMDAFFVPHEKLIPEFTANGLPAGKLIPTGIPVRRAFYEKTDSVTARRQLGLPEYKRIVLLMCGSMGAGPIQRIVRQLVTRMPENAALVAICGNNHALQRKLSRMSAKDRVYILGYCNQIERYMDACDLILTKAGGLSSTEAAVKRIPILYMNAVPGCESRNLIFFKENGYADSCNTIRALVSLVCSYLIDPACGERLTSNLERNFPPNAARNIYKYILAENLEKKTQKNA